MKQWTVTYREKSGLKTSVIIEAEDRAGLFAELKQRGINAISITEGAVKAKRKATGGVSKGVWGVVAAVVVVAICGIVLTMFLSSEEKLIAVEKVIVKEKIEIKNAPKTPIKRNEKKQEENRETAVARTCDIRYWERPNTNGMSDAQIRKWKFKHLPPPAYTNDAMLLRAKPQFEIFNTRAENEVAMLLTITPGEGLVGSPQYDEAFKAEFLKSYETPILVDENDTEYEKQLKLDMIAVKAELRDRIAKGEDICQIMTDTRLEAMRLGQIRQQIESATREMLFDARSPEELDIAVEAANKLLEKEGIAPIKMSPMLKRSLLRRMQ